MPSSTGTFPAARVIVRSVLVDKAAELLGVSRRTVYYRIREGKLQTFRTRGGSQRVLLDSIEQLLRGSVAVGGILTTTSLDSEMSSAEGCPRERIAR